MQKFDHLLKSNYLFHLHTHHTDAFLSVDDYARYAFENGFSSVIYTEHVNRDLGFDFPQFVQEVETCRQRYPSLDLVVGVEAKILPGGGLDIPDEIIDSIELIGIACHGFPRDGDLYFEVMEGVLTDPLWGKERVWVHPGLFFLQFPELRLRDWRQRLRKLADIVNDNGMYGEKNIKYGLPSLIFPELWFSRLIIGWDLHNQEDLHRVRPAGKNMV